MAESTRKITTSLENWKFQTQHVQQNLTGGDFVGSHGCILCATVPRLEDLADSLEGNLSNPINNSATEDLPSSIAIPIGVIDTATMQQDRQLAQIFEIGSQRSYILASGRTVNQMSLARVFYKGANLLRMLYSYYPALAGKYADSEEIISADTGNILRDNTKDASTSMGVEPIGMDNWLRTRLPGIKNMPGYNNVWMNLASDVFSQPCGLIMFMKDNTSSDVAALFLEECYVQNHGFNINANSIILAENSLLRFERIVPIKVKIDEYQSTGNSTSGILQSDAFSNLA